MLLLIGVSDSRAHIKHPRWEEGVSTCNYAHTKVPTYDRSAENMNVRHVGAQVSLFLSPRLIVISPPMKVLLCHQDYAPVACQLSFMTPGPAYSTRNTAVIVPQHDTSRL